MISQLEDRSRTQVREVEAESLKTGGIMLSWSIGHNELVQEGTGWFDFAFYRYIILNVGSSREILGNSLDYASY